MRAFPIGAALLAASLCHLPPAHSREVWHAMRDLQPGDLLRPQDIDPAEPRRDSTGFIEASQDIVGQEVKRRIRAGTAIPARAIGERALVRASQPVRVFWKAGGLSLEMQGKALEDGPLGREIRVHNPGSGRTIRAQVVSEGTAEILGAP
ncbi:flagellar basal body P-ring formation chaperone FlgA [Roseomonas marmotae]|uniref:Flagella basal body P-ring formation protein FlgA n=1 Tax=Roseomonas marmotae TaxID=2768161 RepID=A0ABS3KGL6_9PROT|nr:flagellar basal body P-ring formation chaperone FlgA [Roseomonas marmotae]MBO1076070.1 flagellar basal body P-ring formation protein FlgA [Roseomonas marmotae]QTI81309.1 flagellar basal body P-ring formation protein FlgA [Roseomonas marmotae]